MNEWIIGAIIIVSVVVVVSWVVIAKANKNQETADPTSANGGGGDNTNTPKKKMFGAWADKYMPDMKTTFWHKVGGAMILGCVLLLLSFAKQEMWDDKLPPAYQVYPVKDFVVEQGVPENPANMKEVFARNLNEDFLYLELAPNARYPDGGKIESLKELDLCVVGFYKEDNRLRRRSRSVKKYEEGFDLKENNLFQIFMGERSRAKYLTRGTIIIKSKKPVQS